MLRDPLCYTRRISEQLQRFAPKDRGTHQTTSGNSVSIASSMLFAARGGLFGGVNRKVNKSSIQDFLTEQRLRKR